MRMSLIALTAFKSVVLGRKAGGGGGGETPYLLPLNELASIMDPAITTLTATLLSWLVGYGCTVSEREVKRRRISVLTGVVEEETVLFNTVTPPSSRGYSYHLPIHRLLSWLLRVGYRIGLSLSTMLPISTKEALMMAYHPSKCIAVNSEVFKC